MKKQKIQFIAACVVLVACVGAYLLLQAYNKNNEESEESTEIAVKEIDTDEITGFSYIYEGQTLAFTKEGEEWKCSSLDADIDEDSISALLGKLDQISAAEKISPDEYGSLTEYGLDEPANTITITTAKTTETILIGSYNEMLSEYYMKVDGDENVYLVDSAIPSAFEVGADSFIIEKETETE